jgi:ABC-2 type transport system ATP-binding protein
MNTIINLTNVSKNFDKKQVLKDVSFSVSEKEIFGLLGPSGAGKTTIINILTGQMKITSGEVTVFGIDNDKLTESAYSSMGMVFDTPALFYQLTCYQNLSVFAEIHNVKKKDIPEILEKVNLANEAKTKAIKLSKGMMQRLAIARAVLHRPKLLFLDEPTSGLDPTNAAEIHKLIYSLRDQGTTIFLTTHKMDEAMKMCNNIALLNKGVIMEYGDPNTVCRKYNMNKMITITLKNNEIINLPENAESADLIAEYMKSGNIETIHSSEPSLEDVFLTVTKDKGEIV